MIDLTRRSFTEATNDGISRWGLDTSDERRMSALMDLQQLAIAGSTYHDEPARLIFWMQRNGEQSGTLDNLRKLADDEADAYMGEHESPADFAQELFAELNGHDFNESLWRYIDWAEVWNCELAYDYDGHYTTDGKFHVWREI